MSGVRLKPDPVRLPVGFAGADPPDRWPRSSSVPRPERLEAAVETLTGIGPALARRLARIGIERVGDLLWQRPRRYEEPVPAKRVSDLFGDEEAVIDVVVKSASSRRRGRLKILTARVVDESGEIQATWFNQPWLETRLTPGTRIRLRGRANKFGFAVSSYDLDGEVETADFAPVYPATEDLSQKKLRDLRLQALELVRDVGEPLPAELRSRERLPLRADAVGALHRPRTLEEAEIARCRLAFEELVVLRLALARTAAARERRLGGAVARADGADRRATARRFRSSSRHIKSGRSTEIDGDLARTTPMQRLLQGEVGSGKTVVALYALLRAVEAGRQGALMAPTETLAEQHFLTVDELCAPLGVRVSLLTSALRAREHAAVRQLIASGDAAIVVGTHALIQKEVDFHDLAVAVVDEQHRFGVGQRSALVEGRSPHVLHLTATPIPRTLALTVYGDLDVSELTLPPADRKPIVTGWVTEERSSEAYTPPSPPPRRRKTGLRRLPADRGVGDERRARRRGGGRAAERSRARGLPRGLPPRQAQDRRAQDGDGRVQGAGAGRPRGDDRDRGRRRRPERDDHDRAGGRSVRARAAPPAPRACRARRRAVLLPSRLAAA